MSSTWRPARVEVRPSDKNKSRNVVDLECMIPGDTTLIYMFNCNERCRQRLNEAVFERLTTFNLYKQIAKKQNIGRFVLHRAFEVWTKNAFDAHSSRFVCCAVWRGQLPPLRMDRQVVELLCWRSEIAKLNGKGRSTR